uniref:D-isomer specific 2-hydroxyacid dehydrogenase NAD-binding domain-containing protein n=1 Tax=Oryza nivara TaxID=4536 RepID=A0A0E0GG55_ORYNI
MKVALKYNDQQPQEQHRQAGGAQIQHVKLNKQDTEPGEPKQTRPLPTLNNLPRATKRRSSPYKIISTPRSTEPTTDTTLAAELRPHPTHSNAKRAEKETETLKANNQRINRPNQTSTQHTTATTPANATRCRGAAKPISHATTPCPRTPIGNINPSNADPAPANRKITSPIQDLYLNPSQPANGKAKRPSIVFPSAARRMDTLNDLLAASDLVSLHCTLTNDTMHILNADCLQHVKPGAFIVNTGSCQLIDDCALKQLLIDGTIAGCALDGAEGPQWMEAWVREMPNVLILPRSADYSEEVWMEIREKAITILQSFFFDGAVPSSAISDEDEEISEAGNEDDQLEEKVSSSQVFDSEQQTDESQLKMEYEKRRAISQHKEPQASARSQHIVPRSEGRRSRSGKKGKKRPARRRSQQKTDELSAVESGSNYSSRRDDDTAMSGRDQVLSSSSRFASPEDSKYKQKSPAESPMEITSETKLPTVLRRKYPDTLKDGFVVALRTKDNSGFHVARQRLAGGGGWILDIVSNATNRDPAAQFLVTFKNKDTMGLRSFVAGGKLLQINRRMEFVFASHTFDVWESWMLEGSLLEGCKLINCRNSSAVLDVCIEILAAASEEDGVTRWLD